MYLDFVKYFLKAKNAHSIHSPFVFEFYNQVFKDNTYFFEFKSIEAQRRELETNKKSIKRLDLGAGKKDSNPKEEIISNLAKSSLKPKKWGQFLFRLIKFYNYQDVLDLGTSFGITTAYMAKANEKAKVYTLEGCPETLKLAKNTFKNLDLTNIITTEGNINETLSSVLNSLKKIDLVFFDANHKKEPTISYFEKALTLKNEKSCFVFDDIYWSDEMKEAWEIIKKHPEVSISIDLFYVGLVFFRKGVEKQHFTLK